MIWNLIIIYFLLSPWDISNSSDTTLQFDIILHNKVIGNLKSSQTTKDDTIYYRSETHINTRVIKDIQVNYTFDVAFKNSLLKRANVNITINDKPHAQTNTKWEHTAYKIVKNDDREKILKDSISYTTIQLFFQEPININSCYSEQDGSFNTIVPMGNHSYKKINSKGKENMYYYKHGFLKKATIDGGLISFEMIAREQ
ncbi:DUF6134 family protein [Aquimarina sp. I32.4]|uniref:DUF6134 family protein n=1 Tax=Aquimarina sp. I32.4 TaxID=2053903 RepID=UPI000CDE5A16|nr:DUF6134 family protein [Aquimarina sp. I32.4]